MYTAVVILVCSSISRVPRTVLLYSTYYAAVQSSPAASLTSPLLPLLSVLVHYHCRARPVRGGTGTGPLQSRRTYVSLHLHAVRTRFSDPPPPRYAFREQTAGTCSAVVPPPASAARARRRGAVVARGYAQMVQDSTRGGIKKV